MSPEALVEGGSLTLLELVNSLDVVLGIKLGGEPKRATDDRTSPKTYVRRVLKTNMAAHVNFNECLAIRAVGVVNVLPFLQEWVDFIPIGSSLESQGVGERRRT